MTSLPRNAQNAIASANEGDAVTVHISDKHPIAKIRFAPSYQAEGGFVCYKHGVLKLTNAKGGYQMIPGMVITDVKVAAAPTITNK